MRVDCSLTTRVLSTARTLKFCQLQLTWRTGAYDRLFVILVVKLVFGKRSAFSQLISHKAVRPCAISAGYS